MEVFLQITEAVEVRFSFTLSCWTIELIPYIHFYLI